MNKRQLSNKKLSLSELGFGGAGIGNLFRTVSMSETQESVSKAQEIGVNYFDTAPHYGAGLSERRLGVALHESKVDDCVVSTKVGRLLAPMKPGELPQEMGFVDEAPFLRTYDYSYDAVMRSFEHSIQRLGVAKIDMLFMHDIGQLTHGDEHQEIFKTAMDSGYRALDDLRAQGLVDCIGLGVNEWEVCSESLAHTNFDCFMVANCFTLLNNNITDSFTGECEQKGIDLIVAAPFNSGVLATGSKNPSAYFYQQAPAEVIEKVKRLEALCETYNVTLGAAAIQYPLMFPLVKNVVLGMSNPKHIDKSFQWYQEEIPAEFWSDLVSQNLVGAIGR